MTRQNENEQSGATVLAFGRLAIAEENVTTVAKEKTASEPREAQMAALRRIFGDGVLEIFPKELREAVDNCYAFWQANPDSYINTQFDTADELRDSLIAMRAYAECADNGGYTIRTLSKEDPTLLTWRAQNRRVINRDK